MSDSIKLIMAQVFEIEAGSIDDDTSPDSVERWDSLKHMQLVMALEDEFDIEFPDELIPELLSYRTIADSVDKLTAT